MKPQALARPILVSGLSLLLTACGSGGNDAQNCEYASGNLLQDSTFSTLDKPKREQAWRYSQHAGEKSFIYSAQNGILRFEKTGDEPWALLTQNADTESTKGQRIEYSAELKLDLKDPRTTHGFGYGAGLSLMAKKNNRVILSSSLDHEPHMGIHGWHTARVIADLPKGTTYLRLGFLHQAGGSFQIRNPSLRLVAGGCEATVTEK